VLRGGAVLALIGDVAGKGIRAAGLTETVRSTMAAFATIDPAPAFIMRKTNELLLQQNGPDDAHVTALACIIDPATGHVSLASAGHPPPVHLSPSSCDLWDMPFGSPLGSFPADYHASHLTLTPEDYLVLYTDGLTEARQDGELFGEDRLLLAVESLRGRSAQEMAEGLASAALEYGGGLRDDLNIVVVRLA
jgi:phosphoserine phosphatase RsbU/P